MLNKLYFAQLTEHHQSLCLSLPRCMIELYYWLLRKSPAGKTQEIDLRDFESFSGYSLKYIKQCFKQLIEYKDNLLKLIKQYNSCEFIVVCDHPETVQKIRQNDEKSRQHGEKIRQKMTSNPIETVTLNIDKREQQTPVVVENEIKLNLDSQVCTEEITTNKNVASENLEQDSLPRDIEEKVNIIQEEIEGVTVTAPLRKLLQETTLNLVLKAVKAVKLYKQEKEVKNPTGLIFTAIKEQWQPTSSQHNAGSQNEEFKAWYTEAVNKGIIPNDPPESLPLDSNGEPMIRLTDSFGIFLMPWRKLVS